MNNVTRLNSECNSATYQHPGIVLQIPIASPFRYSDIPSPKCNHLHALMYNFFFLKLNAKGKYFKTALLTHTLNIDIRIQEINSGSDTVMQ